MIDSVRSLLTVFPYAIAAGFLIATVCSLLGVFVILKRVVFIGIALSEAAALGVAAAIMFHIHPFLGATVVTLATVAILAYPFERQRLPRDAVLGIIFVLASSLSVLLVARSGFGLHEVQSLLYGDLILTDRTDLAIILVTLVPVLIYLLVFIRPSLYTFLDREAARVMGVRVMIWELLFFFSLGVAVSAASKVAGALLVFCYLVVTPSAALLLSKRLWLVMFSAVLVSVAATMIGMVWSFRSDLPTNQAVAAVACGLFAAVLVLVGIRRLLVRRVPAESIRLAGS
ncbi:metal ABC transporter permease [Anaerobaca lacustris]|uniref:Metal ABC transporter permease n=1 Tax=Anaerobaca lacustris TaxID=3044600 RepID=A0AAW6U326_9BACT|nr:metal ABC transporter permease [Sedimentisphaerales bacterium M17dextr]